jgi:hypothetical protein
MNWQQQALAQKMLGEWAMTFTAPEMVKTYRRYLKEYAPSLVDSLNDSAVSDYFTKVLYGHFGTYRKR